MNTPTHSHKHWTDEGGHVMRAEETKISWSGRICCFDNILIERLWSTLKHEEVYLLAYSDGWVAEISLACFL